MNDRKCSKKSIFHFFDFLPLNTKNFISQRQIELQSSTIAHFSRLIKGFPHAFTCNPSCVDVS